MQGFTIWRRARAIKWLVALSIAIVAPAAFAADHQSEVVAQDLSLVDTSRGIKASKGFAGSDVRRIDVKVWQPENADAGPFPLIIYSHGTFGYPDNAMHLVNALVQDGYVLAAINYPLTSRTAFTKISFADISDVAQQVKDISFVIDALTGMPGLGDIIDKDRIGTTGHSLGAVTSYFASFGMTTRDKRIKATAPIAAGDPVQTALDNEMGVAGVRHSEASVPVLFLSGDKDVFARMTGRPHAAYSRVEAPKYEILVKNGYHIAFRDGTDRHPEGKNPDCLFFEKTLPGVPIPGCEEAGEFIAPEREQEITREALTNFFDAYLKDDAAALARLKAMGAENSDIDLVYDAGEAE